MKKFQCKLKKKINFKRCVRTIRGFLMESPSENRKISRKKTTPRIGFDVTTTPDRARDEHLPGTSGQQEDFIPLAARDSEWVGLSFYNPHFKTQQEYDDQDEKELQSISTDGNENTPIYLMFPRLKEAKLNNLLPAESTTNVTKMLVGQKADFTYIKSSNKKVPHDVSKLQAVPELHEERDVWDEAGRDFVPGDSRGNSNQFISEPMESDPYDLQSELEDDTQPRRKRKRKHLSDCPDNDLCNSSDSDLVIPAKRKPPRFKNHSLVIKTLREYGATSSQENFGDDENDSPNPKK